MKRKGRFDEIFCVNLPNTKERESIFEVHIKKNENKNCINKGEKFDYNKLAKETSGFNGGDIESVVNQTIENCFLEGKQISTDELIKTAKKTLSITKSCKKQIDAMRKVFAESSFRDATTGEITIKKD